MTSQALEVQTSGRDTCYSYEYTWLLWACWEVVAAHHPVHDYAYWLPWIRDQLRPLTLDYECGYHIPLFFTWLIRKLASRAVLSTRSNSSSLNWRFERWFWAWVIANLKTNEKRANFYDYLSMCLNLNPKAPVATSFEWHFLRSYILTHNQSVIVQRRPRMINHVFYDYVYCITLPFRCLSAVASLGRTGWTAPGDTPMRVSPAPPPGAVHTRIKFILFLWLNVVWFS